MGRKRERDRYLPPSVYRHGRRYRMRVYIGRDNRPAWHNFKATTREGFFKEWARYLGKSKNLFMRDIFARYLSQVSTRKAADTLKSDKAAIAALSPAFGSMRPGEVKSWQVATYIDERGLKAPVRANREKALLSHAFTKCRHWGIVEHNPCSGLYHANPETPRTRYVTDQELRQAMRLATPLLRYVIWLAAMTGLRRRDLLSLTWAALGREGLLVTLSKSRRAGAAPKRLLFLATPQLRRLLARIWGLYSNAPVQIAGELVPDDPVFKVSESSFGSRWSRFQSQLVAAGAERFQLKDLRAKHATDTTAKGGDATAHLGHSSASTTRRHYQRRPVLVVLTKK